MRRKEIQTLKKKLKKAKSDEEQNNLKYLLNRTINQDRSFKATREGIDQTKKVKSKIRQETGSQFVNKCKYMHIYLIAVALRLMTHYF